MKELKTTSRLHHGRQMGVHVRSVRMGKQVDEWQRRGMLVEHVHYDPL